MSKVKILCVGIGGYANVYLEALLHSKADNFEIAGLVDINPKGCKFLNELKDVPLYSDMEDFYDQQRADLCIITTPINLHTEQILTALRNGSNVMCEKPLSGKSDDERIIEEQSSRSGKFVSIGFQWSFSDAINNLKNDIIKGIYGKPEFLKSIVLWPRPKEYYTRGSGWAGRIKASDGTPINDSVANNATAHYLHNMLYVLGGVYGRSSEVTDLYAELLRVNDIENFDSAVIKFRSDCGAECLFIASHSTQNIKEPCFEYRFENGTVYYDDSEKCVYGKLKDGTVIEYGNPFFDINKKIFDAIEGCISGNYIPPCSAKTAAPQVRCIEKVQKNKIYNVRSGLIKTKVKYNDNFLYVEGLDEILLKCYEEEKTISELNELEKLVDIDEA